LLLLPSPAGRANCLFSLLPCDRSSPSLLFSPQLPPLRKGSFRFPFFFFLTFAVPTRQEQSLHHIPPLRLACLRLFQELSDLPKRFRFIPNFVLVSHTTPPTTQQKIPRLRVYFCSLCRVLMRCITFSFPVYSANPLKTFPCGLRIFASLAFCPRFPP